MSDCRTCHATIRSPWKMGMTFTCQRPRGHAGNHGFSTSPFSGPPQAVEWTGCEEKLTAKAVASCRTCGAVGVRPVGGEETTT